MSKIFRWYYILARRENMKRRAKEYNIMIAADKSLKEIDFRELGHDVAEIRFKYNRNSWRVIMVYSQDIEKTGHNNGTNQRGSAHSNRRGFYCQDRERKRTNKRGRRKGEKTEKVKKNKDKEVNRDRSVNNYN